MAETSVERFYADGRTLIAAISADDISTSIFASDLFKKTLLLSIASHFEKRITELVLFFVAVGESDAHPSRQFALNKALFRQYHQLFNWDSANANRFFAFFGSDFTDFMVERIRASEFLKDSIGAFLDLGRRRNEMVHGNFESFYTDDTADEIFSKFMRAHTFVEDLPVAFESYLAAKEWA